MEERGSGNRSSWSQSWWYANLLERSNKGISPVRRTNFPVRFPTCSYAQLNRSDQVSSSLLVVLGCVPCPIGCPSQIIDNPSSVHKYLVGSSPQATNGDMRSLASSYELRTTHDGRLKIGGILSEGRRRALRDSYSIFLRNTQPRQTFATLDSLRLLLKQSFVWLVASFKYSLPPARKCCIQYRLSRRGVPELITLSPRS